METNTQGSSWMPNNQYFLGTLWLLILGGISGSLYLLAKQLIDLFMRTFITTVTLDNKTEAFEWLMRWLGEAEARKTEHEKDIQESKVSLLMRCITFFSEMTSPKHTNTLTLKVLKPNARKNAWGDTIDDGEQQIEFLPGPGNHIFKYGGKFFWMNRYASDKVSVQGWDRKPFVMETLTLTSYGRDKDIYQELFMAAKKSCQKKDSNRTKIYVMDEYGSSWQLALAKHPRTFESVVLDTDLAERIYQDAHEFLNSREFYTTHGLPWRRGYLLYGAPGCGKTSFTQALAARLELNICVLTLSGNTLDDQKLTTRLHDTPARSIILLEDVDCVFVERGTAEDNRGSGSRVTFSGLLNAIDGVASQEGRIFLMTTNHLEKLDAALQRPGRCDVKVEFKMASQNQLYNMFCRFFDKETDQEFVKQCATKFSEALPEHTVSMANLQEHLMRHKGNPQSALDKCNNLLEDVDGMEKEATKIVYIDEWLRRLGISQYTDIFHQRNVFALKDLSDIDEHTLSGEFKIEAYGHREKILGMLKGRKDLIADFEYATAGVTKKIFVDKYGDNETVSKICDAIPEGTVSVCQLKGHASIYTTAKEALEKIDELTHPRTKLYREEELTAKPFVMKEWLESLALTEFADKFAENEIQTQDDVMELTDSDLKDIAGIEKKGIVLKVMASINAMKKEKEKREKLQKKCTGEEE